MDNRKILREPRRYKKKGGYELKEKEEENANCGKRFKNREGV